MREAWCHADAACQLLSAWYVVDFVSVKTYVLSSLSNRVFPLTDLTHFIARTAMQAIYPYAVLWERMKEDVIVSLSSLGFVGSCPRAIEVCAPQIEVSIAGNRNATLQASLTRCVQHLTHIR